MHCILFMKIDSRCYGNNAKKYGRNSENGRRFRYVVIADFICFRNCFIGSCKNKPKFSSITSINFVMQYRIVVAMGIKVAITQKFLIFENSLQRQIFLANFYFFSGCDKLHKYLIYSYQLISNINTLYVYNIIQKCLKKLKFTIFFNLFTILSFHF